MTPKALYWRTVERLRHIRRDTEDRLKPLLCQIQQRNNHGIYAIHIDAKVGFFAQLNWCLYIFAYCEQFNLSPSVVLSSPLYTRSKGEDWLGFYFDTIKLTQAQRNLIQDGRVSYSTISEIKQLGLARKIGSPMTIEKANRLMNENLRLKPDIDDYVSSFVSRHFTGRIVLGIHYRGTDKTSEAAKVSFEYTEKAISSYLDKHPEVNAIFVASDETAFIEWIQAKINHLPLIFHDDTQRSADGKATHIQSGLGDNYLKGKEALVNCLLLSKCSAVIRTASFLSAWSSIFNPQLPVIMLNQPYENKAWFPDSEIIKRARQGYLPSRA